MVSGAPNLTACKIPVDTAAALASFLAQVAEASHTAVAQAVAQVPCCPSARAIAQHAWPTLSNDILDAITQGKPTLTGFKAYSQLVC